MAAKNFQFEHNKPIFNEQNLLTLHHMYIYQTFYKTFKILKYKIPISLFELLQKRPNDNNILLMIPMVNLDLPKNNFIFYAPLIWNNLYKKY